MKLEPIYLSSVLFCLPLLLAGGCQFGVTLSDDDDGGGSSTNNSPASGEAPTGEPTGTPTEVPDSTTGTTTVDPTGSVATTMSESTTGDTGGDAILSESLLIRVYDPDGNPIPNAVALSRRITHKATPDGAILIRDARPSDNQPVFVGIVTAPGYSTMSVVAEIPKDHPVARRAVLKPLGPPKPIPIADGGWAEHEGVLIYFPPNSFVDLAGLPIVDEGGLPAKDPVDVSITPYLAGDDRDSMPAPLLAKDDEGIVYNLMSAGMFEVNLTYDGEPVKLRDGVSASLEVELPVSLYDQVAVGETIDSWSLDTKLGIWSLEGPGYVHIRESDQKLVWRAEASHFSVYNVDWTVKEARCLELKIVDSANKPRAGMATYVDFNGWIWPMGPVFAGNDGKVCMELPVNLMASINVGLDPAVPIAEPVDFFANPISPPSICPPGLASNFGEPWGQENPDNIMPGPCEQRTIQVYDNPVCTPGEYTVCEPLPNGVEEVGICAPGLTICNEYGTAWLPCAPPVLPELTDGCNPVIALDDDCDGDVDEDCMGPQNSCDPMQVNPPESKLCYKNKPGDLEGVAVGENPDILTDQEQLDMFGYYKTCKPGLQTCVTMQGMDYGEFGTCDNSVLPGMEICETFDIDENCDGWPTCALTAVRARRAGHPTKHHFATAIAVDGMQNAFVAVAYGGNSAEYGAPACNIPANDDNDVLLYRVDDGATTCSTWAHALGGGGTQWVGDLAIDIQNNVVAGGWFSQQLKQDGACNEINENDADHRGLIARYTSTGFCAWRKSIGSPGSTVEVHNIVTDKTPALDIYALGQVQGPLAADGNCPMLAAAGTGKDIFLAHYDKNGNCLQRLRIASPIGTEDEYPRDLTFDDAGANLWFTGSFKTKINLDVPYSFGSNSERIFVARIDPMLDGIDKSRTWGETVNLVAYHTVVGLAALDNGDMALAGTFGGAINFAPNDQRASIGESDIYTAVLKPDMTLVAAHNYGSPTDDTVSAIASSVGTTDVRYFTIAGTISGPGLNLGTGELMHSHEQDIFIARARRQDGKILNTRVFSDDKGDQIVNAIAVDLTGYIYFAGQMEQGILDVGTLQPLNNLNTTIDSILGVLAP